MDIVTESKLLMISLGAAPVMWLMIGLSIISVAIIVERVLFFLSARGDFAQLARTFAQHLRTGDLEGAHRLLAESRSLEAEVVIAGVDEAERGAAAAREAMAGASAAQSCS